MSGLSAIALLYRANPIAQICKFSILKDSFNRQFPYEEHKLAFTQMFENLGRKSLTFPLLFYSYYFAIITGYPRDIPKNVNNPYVQ